MSAKAARTEIAEPAEPPITQHYVLVLVIEAALLLVLYWLDAHFS